MDMKKELKINSDNWYEIINIKEEEDYEKKFIEIAYSICRYTGKVVRTYLD